MYVPRPEWAARMRRLALTILGKNNNDRSSKTFQNYCPHGYAIAKAGLPPIGTTLFDCDVMLARLGEEQDPDLREHFDPIKQARDRLEQAVVALKSAQTEERTARVERKGEKRRWLESYTGIYHDLFVIFPNDRPRVETYFRRFDRATDVAEEPPGEPAIEQAAKKNGNEAPVTV
jgi:hypothetical protein